MFNHYFQAGLFGLAYALLLIISSHFLLVTQILHLAWAPLALLTTVFMATPSRRWPLLGMAAIAAELLTVGMGISEASGRLFGLITIFESAALVWLYHSLSGTRSEAAHLPDIHQLLIYTGLSLLIVPPLANLVVAVLHNVLFDASESAVRLWLHGWQSDSVALLVLVPFFAYLPTVLRELRRGTAAAPKNARVRVELAAIIAVQSILWSALFLNTLPYTSEWSLSPALLLLPLVWAAVRLPFNLTALVAAASAMSGLWATQLGLGPFQLLDPLHGISQAQQFFVCVMIVPLLIASLVEPARRDRQQRDFFENAVRFSREGIVITSAEGDQPILYCNPAFERISGYRSEEVVGRNCRFMNHQHHDQEGIARVREAITARKEVEVVVQNTRKNGEVFWCSLSIAPVFSDGGRAKYFIGVQSDVTEDVQAHQSMEAEIARQTADLQSSQQRVVMASEVSGLGIWDWNTETGELIWDDNMHRIYETPEDRKRNLLYEFWEERVHPVDVQRAAQSLQSCVESGKDWRSEFRLLFPDGRIRYIRASAKMKVNADGHTVRVLGGNLDITDTRILEASLREAAEQARRADQLKSEFLANMSHEIRTPLNGVLGMVDLLRNTSPSPVQSDYINMIRSSASSLLNVLNDILDISKIEAGQLEIHPEPVHLEECLGLTVKGQAQAAFARGLELHYYVDPDLHMWVLLDAQRFAQIINNLLSNAIKFTAKGEIQVTARADRSGRHGEQEHIVIEVMDTGIGMAAETLETIFDPFQQADGSVSRRFGGTGLGLAISKRLVTMQGGTIEAESTEGVGSTFRVSLPLRKTRALDLRPQDQQRQNVDIREALQRCLIVDDNAINRRWLADMVNNWGGQPQLAESGKQALTQLRDAAQGETPIDIMLLDKNMPDLNGFDLVRQMKEEGLPLPRVILMLSSSDVDADVELARDAGIHQYLLKPVLQSEVYDAVVTLLGHQPDSAATPTNTSQDTAAARRFLVAEDNPVNQRLLVDALQARGHAIDTVEDGQAAIQLRESQPYDAIFMDVQMPVMDGLEATRHIRQREKDQGLAHIPIIGITANAMKGDRETCLAAGMTHYLTKPVNLEQLYQLIDAQFDVDGQPPQKKLEAVASASHSKESRPPGSHFDERVGLSVCGDNRGLLVKVVKKAIEVCPAMQAELAGAIAAGDAFTAARLAHKLKGAIANFCTPQLPQALKALELEVENLQQQEREHRWRAIDEMLTTLKQELTHYTDAEQP